MISGPWGALHRELSLINLKDNDSIAAVAKVMKDEDDLDELRYHEY